MNRTDVHHPLFPAIHGIACQQGQVEQRTVAPHLELIVQRAGQTDKDCCDCSGISGRFHCEPSAVRGEWRYTEAGIDVVVSLIRREGATGPRWRALLLVEQRDRVHAAIVYHSKPLGANVPKGPWSLKLTSAESECNLPFPEQVEIICHGRPPMQMSDWPSAIADNSR